MFISYVTNTFSVDLASSLSPRCRGLKVLVDLLDEDYTEQADLVSHALVGVSSVFELQVSGSPTHHGVLPDSKQFTPQSPTPKNDFCRMFIREGLLDVRTYEISHQLI